MIQIGQLFADRYTVLKEVGRGGMANVYLGEDTFIDHRKVAIKVLRPNFENDSIAIARFQREAFSMAELSHPNIVSITDVGEADGSQYIVMEFVDGPTLKQYIKEHAPLSNEEAINITTEILSAMQMAHGHGIVHRDLKPQNILMSTNGTAKVTDFGIAKALSDTSLTQTNTMFGSVHYLSPEQARGANATMQSDIYAIGIILFELLTGNIPFDGDSAVAIALKHFQENIPSIINQNKNVPQALENVVIKATAKKPEDRYENVAAMMSDLASSTSLDRAGEAKLVFKKDKNETKVMPKNLIDSTDTTPLTKPKEEPKVETTPEPEEPKKKSKKGLIAGIIVALLLIAGVAAAWIGLTPNNVNVPNVQNMTVQEAESKIKSAGLEVGNVQQESNSQIAEGRVTRTNPQAGQSARRNSKVTIYKSAGGNAIKMDNYVGKDYDAAVSALQLKGVTTGQINQKAVANDAPQGQILKQTPAAGSYFNLDGSDNITFEVSAGPAQMPDIQKTASGLSSTTAISYYNALQNLGVSSSNVTFQDSNTGNTVSNSNLDGYYVISANPEPGSQIDPSSTKITLQLAKATAASSAAPSTSPTTQQSEPATSAPATGSTQSPTPQSSSAAASTTTESSSK